MKHFNTLIRLAQLLALPGLLLVTHLAGHAAGSNATTLAISATVLPRTQLEILSAPGSLTIGRADVERGFIDVETPVSVAVTSNNPRGAMLMLSAMSDYIEQASMSGLANSVVIGRDGGIVMVPSGGSGKQRTSLTLRFRLFLAKATPPGIHAWPIRLSANVM